MEKHLPFKVNVASQWVSGNLCVQVIEIAENVAQMLLGGSYMIRIRIVGSDEQEMIGFATKAAHAKELHAMLGHALEAFETLSGEKVG
jgi:hypothetical protein